jgi:hypothetical protein
VVQVVATTSLLSYDGDLSVGKWRDARDLGLLTRERGRCAYAVVLAASTSGVWRNGSYPLLAGKR